MKNEIPVAIAFVAGMLMVISLFIPHPYVAEPAAVTRSWAIIITAFAYVLGVANIARISVHSVRNRSADWEYKAALIVALFAMAGVGIAGGIRSGGIFDWAYLNMYVPMQATMFSLLAFYVYSKNAVTDRKRGLNGVRQPFSDAVGGHQPVNHHFYRMLFIFGKFYILILEVHDFPVDPGA